MKNLSLTVNSLQSKIEKLVHLHRKGADDNARLLKELESIKLSFEKQKQTIKTLDEQNKIIKLAKTITETNENSSDIKLKINELVREIDKCIALLNK